ncbi:MAG TPA: amidohydrolase family protein [Pseudolabrys sp.]
MSIRCDSHVHVVGPAGHYPQVADRTYLADIASLDDLERAAATRGVRRFVIVQPSFYGTDNSVLLETLDRLAGRGRGVAVLDQATPRETLAGLHRRGVRGMRINLYSPLGEAVPLDARFKTTEAQARALDWHVEVIAPLAMVAENAALLAAAKVPVVIDHYGLYAGFTPAQAEGRALIDLLRMPHVWMKLSAPYRVSDDALATRPDPAWLAAILSVAADRCVWGSDWPHTPPHDAHAGGALIAPYRKLRYPAVVDGFTGAVGSAELAERIMSDNPAQLYEFAK